MSEKRRKVEKPFSWVGFVKQMKQKEKSPCDDYFEEKENVDVLNQDSFKQLLNEKDVVLVMFHDPCEKKCDVSKNHFAHAAGKTERENSAYGAVDCTREPLLCDAQQVKSVPTFKLYSKGRVAATVTEFHIFNHVRMKNFVENVPVFNDWTQADDRKQCEAGMNCGGK